MKKTRLLALLLCFIMILIPVSCAKNNEGTDTTTAAPDIQQTTSEAVTTAPIVDENAYPENGLPDDLNFGGEELDMLASEWQGYEYYFFAEACCQVKCNTLPK